MVYPICYYQSMFVNHKTYQIPEQIGSTKINPLAWSDFKGTPPQNTWLLAHIWWAIDYEFVSRKDFKVPYVKATARVLGKSWVGSQDLKLLQHEYGHYLIGCLCALEFEKRVNYQLLKPEQVSFGEWCKKQLQIVIREYCKKQKLYDEETYHYINRDQQCQWQRKIKQEFQQFYNYFQSKGQQSIKAPLNQGTRPAIRPMSKTKIETKKGVIPRRNSIFQQIDLYKRIEKDEGLPLVEANKTNHKFRSLLRR